MNLRKNLGRVASTIVATALLASVATVPAFAATNNNGAYNEAEDAYTFTMTKKLTLPDNVYQPNEVFTFTVNGAEPNGEMKDSVPVTKGGDNDIQDATVTFTSSDTKDTEETITFSIPANTYVQTRVGIYKYLIKESDGQDANMTYDLANRWLYVYVVNDEPDEIPNCDYKIDGVVVYKAPETGSAATEKSDSFLDEYGKKDEQETLKDLVLKKEIEGSAANMSQKFTFDIKITATGDNQVFDIVTDVNKNGILDEGDTVLKQITANDTNATEVELGNDEQIIIVGLRNGDSYEISEQTASEQNGVAKTADGYTVTVTGANDEDKDGKVNGTISEDTNITYKNERSASTPTGIVMNVAPYALLVVVAVAGCFVFLRKRNED